MIHLFTALPCEAMPMVDHYRLKERKQEQLFRLFSTDDNDMTLTITGVGKSNAAAAVSYHHACFHTSPADTWLNIGIAGHADVKLGEACLVNKITDAATHETWYPQVLFESPCQVAPLFTLDTPSDSYQNALYDMEASGFYAIASRIGTSELIHCFKVVSDNATSDSNNVKAKQVRQYMEAHLVTIDSVLSELSVLASELEQVIALPADYQACISTWHFTRTQRVQLQQLLRRWHILQLDTDIFSLVGKQDTAKKVLQTLATHLSNQAFTIVGNARSV